MSDQPSVEQQVSDLIADGKIITEDADAVLVFAQFLRESGPAPTRVDAGEKFPPGHPLRDPVARRAHAARWMPYLQGQADGPIDEEAMS